MARRRSAPTSSPTPIPAPALHITGAARRQAAALLNQQFWCWGQDVRRPEGNLLARYGFNREGKPETISGSSAYHLYDRSSARCHIMGLGLFWGDAGERGLLLRRVGWEPHMVASGARLCGVWNVEQMSQTRSPCTATDVVRCNGLLADALSWIAQYETRVAKICGIAYREQCVAGWRKQRIAAGDMATMWTHLAYNCIVGAHSKGRQRA